MNREKWLTQCIGILRDDFLGVGFGVPDRIRASCSWPSKGALASKRKRIGEAWSAKNSGDNSFEIFISPVLADPIEVAAVLVHELIHCAVGTECGHKGDFKRCAKAIGLEGKMTATVAGDELRTRLENVVAMIGDYPHSIVSYSGGPKKQSTRMRKVSCRGCGCVVRMTRKWIEETGPPTCACGTLMNEEE